MFVSIPSETVYLNIGMVLYGVLASVLFLFGLDLFDRYLKADKRTRKDAAYQLFLMLSLGILGYAVYMVFAIIMDLFRSYVMELVSWLSPLRYTMIIVIIGSFAAVAEKILLKKKRKIFIMGPVLIIGIAVGISATILAYQGKDISTLQQILFSIIAIFALYGFYGLFYILLVKMAPQKEIKKKMQIGLSAAIIAFGGETIQIMSPPTQGKWWILGVTVEIIGWLIIRHYFLSIPSYDEFEWRRGMIEMHVIIAETGISLYYRRFSELHPEDVTTEEALAEAGHRPSTDLVAGGLVGIKGMLSEISGESGALEHIEIGEKSLIFKQGKVIMVLLLTDRNLGVYHAILEDLVEEIERSHPNLDKFNGDTRTLKIGPIVEEYFGLKPEKNESSQ